jgi:nucleotide sugar dehydrogenase
MKPLSDFKIGVVGGGVVGAATARAYTEHVAEVRVYDRDPVKSLDTLTSTLASDIVFICLPESELNSFFDALTYPPSAHFVIRSTVPPGTTASIQKKHEKVVHSPEFLTARVAEIDARIPARNIIGAGARETAELVAELYFRRFPEVPILHMTSQESEFTKLACNAFFAVKISFFNELQNCSWSTGGVDWNVVRDGMLSCGRIAESHTHVPGPDGKFGFGGGCLPKDLSTLIRCAAEDGVPTPIMNAAQMRNPFDRHEE